MSRANQAVVQSDQSDEPVLLTIIGGDIEDDEEEAATVVGTDLESLGIPHLELVTPKWEQPEGVGDADTAPEVRSPVASEPIDPGRTFPPADELPIVEVSAELEDVVVAPYADEAAEVMAAPARTNTPANAEDRAFGIVTAVGIALSIVGVAALGIALLWAI